MSNTVYHWWAQRLSAIIMLFLLPWFMYVFVYLLIIQHDQQIASLILAHPFQLLLFLLLLFFIFWHAVLGMQVICEDYIHHPHLRLFVNTSIKAFSVVTFFGVLLAVIFFIKTSSLIFN